MFAKLLCYFLHSVYQHIFIGASVRAFGQPSQFFGAFFFPP